MRRTPTAPPVAAADSVVDASSAGAGRLAAVASVDPADNDDTCTDDAGDEVDDAMKVAVDALRCGAVHASASLGKSAAAVEKVRDVDATLTALAAEFDLIAGADCELRDCDGALTGSCCCLPERSVNLGSSTRATGCGLEDWALGASRPAAVVVVADGAAVTAGEPVNAAEPRYVFSSATARATADASAPGARALVSSCDARCRCARAGRRSISAASAVKSGCAGARDCCGCWTEVGLAAAAAAGAGVTLTDGGAWARLVLPPADVEAEVGAAASAL